MVAVFFLFFFFYFEVEIAGQLAFRQQTWPWKKGICEKLKELLPRHEANLSSKINAPCLNAPFQKWVETDKSKVKLGTSTKW